MTKEKQMKRPIPSTVYSLFSVCFMAALLAVVVVWHDGVSPSPSESSSTTSVLGYVSSAVSYNDESRQGLGQNEGPFQRWLQANDAPSFDDDKTRTETCKHYLYNFLNGSTDVHDQCEGFYNAYQAADCEDDTNIDLLEGNGVQDDNSNTTDEDDVIIDDFFENWECCDSIHSFYERHCSNPSDLHSSRLLGIMLVMLVCTMIKATLKRINVNWLPDACAFILVGTFVGGILRLFDSRLVQNQLSFDNDLFLQIMLPPIIFQAALSIDKRAFRRDLFPILAFAGLGTAFSAIAIGLITHQVSKWGMGENLPLLDSLVFGSLISSIDPVATLSILAGVGVSQTDTLYTLIFGESLLNDGVAIVLFDTLKSHLGEEDVLDDDAYHHMANHFTAVLFGSIGIGVGVGMLCTIYFWLLRGSQSAVTEVAIFFCWALIPYYIADGLGCSGIIAIMVMGFFMDYFVVGGFQSEDATWMDYMAMRSGEGHGDDHGPHQPPADGFAEIQMSLARVFSGRGHVLSRTRHHVGFVAHVVAQLMETAIFAYLGLFLFNDNVWKLRLNLTAILSCVSSRAVMVVVLSLLINIAVFFDFETRLGRCFRSYRRNPTLGGGGGGDDDDSIRTNERIYLDRKTQLILLLAGVRGAVSFALVENIPIWDTVTKTGSKYKAELKAMTSSSIVFTLFVFGALTYITVKGSAADTAGDGRVAGNLTHRLLSEPLDSDDENRSEMTSSALEIEPPRSSVGGRVPQQQQQHHQQQQQDRYQVSNEWIN